MEKRPHIAAIVLVLLFTGCNQPATSLTSIPIDTPSAAPTGTTSTLATTPTSVPTDTLPPAEAPIERAAAAPTRTIGTPPTTPEFTDDEFSVYLVAQAITAHEMLQINLDELELEDSPIISLNDVVAYAPTTHEMQLTESAYERIGRLEVPVQGLPFVVCVGHERIYGGAFWASYSSLIYGGVVINTSPATVNDPDRILRIELGYPPSPELFVGKDLRSDPRIIKALEAANKLR